jgi:hypothetical protein
MKPRFVIATLLVLALAVPATILAQQSKAEKEIRAFLEQARQANLQGGAEAIAFFDKHTADDWVRITPNGAIFGKSELLNGFKSGSLQVKKADWSIDKIRVYRNWALVTGTESGSWTLNGELLSGSGRWSRVLVKSDGVWKTLLYQSTKLPAKQ